MDPELTPATPLLIAVAGWLMVAAGLGKRRLRSRREQRRCPACGTLYSGPVCRRH